MICIETVGSHETDPFSSILHPNSELDRYLDEAMRNRNGMFDGLIFEFMKETGLKPSEIMLVEESNDFGIRCYYTKRIDND